MTTVSADLLDDRNLTSLNDALRMVPSITLGAGEFSWQGNNPSIRGFNARDDMYLDGLRDFGSYPRDPFNLEQVEILLGPSSVLFGRGSTGGAINQVSKQPELEPMTRFSANVGSDETLRTTADIGRPLSRLGDEAAFRLNLLAHRGEIADRDGAEAERYGIAPTLALGLGSATELTLSYMKQMSDDRPDYGLPWLNGAPADVPRNHFYGFESDYLETDADVFTAQLRHAYSDAVDGMLQMRYASYDRKSRITEPLITDPNAGGLPLESISVYRYVFLGDSEETFLTAQGALMADLQTGSIEHGLVVGFELSEERSQPIFSFGIGVPETSLLEPSWNESFSSAAIETRVRADTTGETIGAYVLDTVKLSEFWQIVAGARWDRFDTDYDATRYAGTPTPFNDGAASGPESYDQVDDVLSYRAALVYKPVTDRTWYLAGSTSFNPSAQSLSMLSTGR
ncbi:MAG TPA: TonB-dependent receptor, partial [Gammaproteobacteria bacterium]|nr:TonB-dependent receptor [Gammaproteobacteria bacterium]